MKKCFLLLYTILSVLYYELVFHVFCFNNFDVINVIFFTLPFILIMYFICSVFNKKINKVLLFIFIGLLSIFFISQFIYYQLFNTVYGIKSVGLANQVLIVFDKVIDVIITKWYVILLNLIPIILLILFNKKIDFGLERKKNIPWTIFYIITTYIMCILSLNIDKEYIYSNYNLYYNTRQPLLTAQNMGLFTSFRLETIRTITNFKEKIEVAFEETPILEKTIEYNITDIDFEALISSTQDEDLNTINNFFKNRQATEKNEYTGLFKDKNLIFILAESLDKNIINKDVTPTLYKLTNESIQFKNYYTPLYNTSTGDGEYVTEWGILPNASEGKNMYAARNNYNSYMLHNNFKSLNYKTSIYHNYYGYFYNRTDYFKKLQFDTMKFCDNGIVPNCNNFRGSDFEMIKNTVNDYINEDNFFTYYITVSGHGNYIYDSNEIARKNYSTVKDLDYSSQVKTYMAANVELDKALEYLIKSLEEKGKLDDTVIVITPDHYPYYLKENMIQEFSTEDKSDKFLIHHENLIIWNSELKEQLKNIKIDKYVANVDILPTLSNLFGLKYDSRLFIGQDALSNSDGVVMLVDHSWINNIGSYDTSSSKFNGSTDIDSNYVLDMNKKVNTYFQISSLIQTENYYKYLFEKLDKLKEEKENVNIDNVEQ